MKCVIIAGGKGTRLRPSTIIIDKNLLPIYDQPLIHYPIIALKKAGITDILIVVSPTHTQQFTALIGNGEQYGVNIQYVIQPEANGIASALSLAENFAKNEAICVLLADNVLSDVPDITGFKTGARIFLKEVPDPQRFGIATIKEGGITKIVEKPKNPSSNLAVIGVYVYDSSVFDIIRTLKPSERGELEITDVNKQYLLRHALDYRVMEGFWSDAGTYDSLLQTSVYVKEHQEDFE